MELDWLRSFASFAERMNFTHAARALNLSQPALHVQVRRLSEDLGVPLYRKVGRTLVLTEQGRQTALFARETLERVATFEHHVRGERSNVPLMLSAGAGAYLYLLGEALAAFRHEQDANLRLLTHKRDGTVAAVLAGQAHLGVTAGVVVAPKTLEITTLTSVPRMLVMRADHALATCRTMSLHRLDGEPLVLPPTGRPHREQVDEALRRAGVRCPVPVEAEGWEQMLAFTRLGLGLSVVNGCVRVPDDLVARPLRELPPIEYVVLERAGGSHHPEAQRMRRTLHRHRSSWKRAAAMTSQVAGPLRRRTR
jgi:LysR family transcriptional regulator, low CO2-responsive transcriptional regulator